MSGTLTRQRDAVRVPSLPRLVGLDGLRAVAVLAVVAYHADIPWLPGGFLGVDVFFVLSGFLITSLLLVELDRTGRVAFGTFYARRARRLLPALFAVLAVTALLVATVAYDAAAGFRRDLPGALFYYSNWLSILTETSYFEFIGRPPMLKHLWSLAVEEQFYIVWPAIAVVAYRWRGARAVGIVALSGALLSTVAMVVGSLAGDMPTGADPSRLYFGTDTHSMGILLGAALAVVWRPGRTSPVLGGQARALITLAGVGGLALLWWSFTSLGEYSTFLYRGGFLVVAACSAVVVAAASHRGVPFGRWLGVQPLRWVGERSYGIYLWHWPLFLVTRPGVDIPFDGGAALVVRLVLLLGIAELSYRYVELPVRNGALARQWRRLRDEGIPRPSRRSLAAAVAGMVIIGTVAHRVVTAEPPQQVVAAEPVQVEVPVVLPPPELPMEREVRRKSAAKGRDERPRATAFGDSVMLGAANVVRRGGLDIDIHARIATQAGALLGVIRSQLKSAGVADIVVLHVGNNGIVTEKQLRGMLSAFEAVPRVVLVNARVPRPWMRPNNRLMERVLPDYPNVVLADWASASAGHRDYMVSDGVHLTPKGAQAYSRLIDQAAGVAG